MPELRGRPAPPARPLSIAIWTSDARADGRARRPHRPEPAPARRPRLAPPIRSALAKRRRRG